MTNSEDYRLYLEEHFNRVHDTLDYIKDQTTKTNSRVTHLEQQRDEYLKTRVTTNMIADCHARLEKIDNDLEEYRFLKRYPKLALTLLIVFLLGTAVSIFGTIETIHNNFRSKNIIENVGKIQSDIK